MFVIVPWQTDVLFPRTPRMNVILIAIIVLTFYGVVLEVIPWEAFYGMILFDWSPSGLFGHLLLHASFFHLAGNMIFLWVFGNAICTKMSDWAYALLFITGGLAAATAHLLFSGGPAVGASGAINCIVGFYLVVYPLNDITFKYGFLWLLPPIAKGGSFQLPGCIMILLWFILDIFGAVLGAQGIAYMAHLGGFVWGLLIGLIVVANRGIELTHHDHQTLWELLSGKKQPRRKRRRTVPSRTDQSSVYTVDID